MSNNLKYIDEKNGIEFTEVRTPQILFKNGPLGIKDRIKHDGTEVTEIDNNDISPLINAVDIDWNGIDVGDSESINTTGDLIAWIKKKGSGGSSGGTILNRPLASVNNLLNSTPNESGLVLTYNGSTYEWKKSSLQSTEKPINYLWAYTVAENDTQALNKLNRTSENNPPNSNYSITPTNPPEGLYLYMTTARKRGEDYLLWDGRNVWSVPVRIGDNTTSGTGADGDGYNYIYCLTDKNTTPSISANTTVDRIESLSNNSGLDFNGDESTNEINVWRDHPHGVREEYPQEWIAVAKSSGGEWSSYQGPSLWSHYGLDGKDGDTIEYVYKLTTSNVTSITDDLNPPTYYYEENGIIYSVNINEEKYQSDDFIPAGWSDNPQSLTTNKTRLWVSTRKREWNSELNKMVWGEFSTPTIWSENSVTIVDSPYVITNDNPAILVICDYQGQSLEVNDTYEATIFTVTKGTTNVSDDFDWTYSVNYINENVNTPEILVTGTFYNGITDSQDYYLIIPSSIAVDKAVITVTATLKDGSFSLSTKVTAKKRKATSPGEIPQAYSLKLSQVVALKNSDGNIINSITIYAKDRLNLLITNIPGLGLTLKVGETLLLDNILTPEDLLNLFLGKDIGETITVSLYYNNEEEDYGWITLINGDVEINVDGYTFALKRNNQTIRYDEELYENGTNFDPSYLEYPIIGYKNGEEIDSSILSNLVSLGICTNCTAEIKTENDQVLLKITPTAIDSGGLVLISCKDEENNLICLVLTATYLLETADYQIRIIRRELTAKASSDELDAFGRIIERNTATITHNSKLLNSTIESLNVFSNLFGFSNNLIFDDSEPFILGYGVEIKPRLSDRSYSSKITNIKLDTSKSVVVGMDIYRSYLSGDSTNSYKIGVHLNGREPSNVLINKESLDANNNLINLNNYEFLYGLSYHVTLIYDYIEPDAENPLLYPSELSFNILGKSRLIVLNLKVELGAVETKFCISDEDATVNNNVNLLPTVGLESDDKSICVRDHADNSDYNNQEASIDENGVITFTNTYVTEGLEWSIFMREDIINPLPAANDVYTLSFSAKASDTELHLMSRIYLPYNRGRLGDYTFYDYTKNIINDPLGITVHKVGTQWKRYYARFYISPRASLYNNVFKVIIACINDNNETPLLDFDNGTTGKIPRSFQIKDIVLLKGYTPSEDLIISDNAHTKSMINLTSKGITLEVSNRLKTTGIDIDANLITLNGNTLVNGMLTLNSDEGFILNNANGSLGAKLHGGEIPNYENWKSLTSTSIIKRGRTLIVFNSNNVSQNFTFSGLAGSSRLDLGEQSRITNLGLRYVNDIISFKKVQLDIPSTVTLTNCNAIVKLYQATNNMAVVKTINCDLLYSNENYFIDLDNESYIVESEGNYAIELIFSCTGRCSESFAAFDGAIYLDISAKGLIEIGSNGLATRVDNDDYNYISDTITEFRHGNGGISIIEDDKGAGTLYLGADYDSRLDHNPNYSWRSLSSLSTTVVYGNYELHSGDCLLVINTNVGITLTLPPAPYDGHMLYIRRIYNTNTVTLSSYGAGILGRGAETASNNYILFASGQYFALIVYVKALTAWIIMNVV